MVNNNKSFITLQPHKEEVFCPKKLIKLIEKLCTEEMQQKFNPLAKKILEVIEND
ncbi:MAG: hypothetical protein MJ180_00110 [Candidatus Gastranaerophilales bacterium]|nr:hypothetical protein [Candidatus Gastranaerophilales bacterium]